MAHSGNLAPFSWRNFKNTFLHLCWSQRAACCHSLTGGMRLVSCYPLSQIPHTWRVTRLHQLLCPTQTSPLPSTHHNLSAVKHQVSSCPLHQQQSLHYPLLEDHKCSVSQPHTCLCVIAEHDDDVLFVKFSNKVCGKHGIHAHPHSKEHIYITFA